MTGDAAQPRVRYAAHLFLWDRCADDSSVTRRIRNAASLGLDIIEIPVGDDMPFSPRRVREAADAAGIATVLSPGGFWPFHADISLADRAAAEFGLRWHRRAIDLCEECGAEAYTGALYGHPGRVSLPGGSCGTACLASRLHALAEYAARRGVRLALEPMSHFRTHLVNTAEQAVALVETADHPNLGILLDTYHLCTEITDYAEAFRRALPYLWGVHACENNRGVPGTGFLPWKQIVGTLTAAGWCGCVGFESYNSSIDGGAFAVSRGMFHGVCPDGDAFVRRGIGFWEETARQSTEP